MIRVLLVFLLSFSLYSKPQKSSKKDKIVSMTELVDQVDSRCKVIKKEARKQKCLKAFKKAYKEKMFKFIDQHYQDAEVKKQIISRTFETIDKMSF